MPSSNAQDVVEGWTDHPGRQRVLDSARYELRPPPQSMAYTDDALIVYFPVCRGLPSYLPPSTKSGHGELIVVARQPVRNPITQTLP